MSGGPSGRLGYRAALASREYRAVLIGQSVSVGGTSIAAVALTILVYRRTASPLLSSLVFSLGFLPYVFGGGPLSSVVDRVRPRRLVAGCDLASALVSGAMAWPAMPVPALLALLLALGTLSAVSSGARAGLVRHAVADDAYVPARSLLWVGVQLAQLGGNAAGGALLVVLSPSGALIANAASFAFSAAAVRIVVGDHPNVGAETRGTVLQDSLRGARAVFARPELRRLLLAGWFGPMFSVAPEALAAPYVAGHGGSPTLVGWWLTALPLGLIAGDIAGVRLLTPERQRRLVAPALLAGFLPYLAFAVDPPVPLALALLVASGACGLYGLGLDARVRDAAPPELFARTMTLNAAGLMTLQGLGFALAGAVAQGIGPAGTVTLAGGLGAAATLALLGGDLRPTRQAGDEFGGAASS